MSKRKAIASLYADACFPRPTVDRLRRLGYDITTVQQTQGTSRPDQSMDDDRVLAEATRLKRCVLTLNVKDFIQCAERNRGHAGIIACDQNPDADRQAQMIDQEIKKVLHQGGGLNGQIRPGSNSAFFG